MMMMMKNKKVYLEKALDELEEKYGSEYVDEYMANAIYKKLKEGECDLSLERFMKEDKAEKCAQELRETIATWEEDAEDLINQVSQLCANYRKDKQCQPDNTAVEVVDIIKTHKGLTIIGEARFSGEDVICVVEADNLHIPTITIGSSVSNLRGINSIKVYRATDLEILEVFPKPE